MFIIIMLVLCCVCCELTSSLDFKLVKNVAKENFTGLKYIVGMDQMSHICNTKRSRL